ncbi:hypothetical protein V8D89_006471 [Ganoderma adspersum]
MLWTPALFVAAAFLGGRANPLSNSDAVFRVEDVTSSQHVLTDASEREHLIGHSPGEWQEQEEPSGTFTKDGVLYHQFAHPAFSDYRLRVTSPEICDPTVKQYSGYLDISDTRHLFFWFFEARKNPESAPLMMWLNGGPGCSSTTGLLFENGPCTITSPNTTVPNPHSWTNVANMIFLDEPIGTGYSYASDHSKVNTLADLAVDVYAFLQLFVSSFPQYAEKPFHLAAESWGGHFGPNIASYVHKMNKRRIYAPFPGQKHIDFASLILANGLTEPATQFESIPEYMCERAPYPPFARDSATCRALRVEMPVCKRMIESCYRFESKATCDPATAYCWLRIEEAAGLSKKNPYDLRIPCKDPNGVCYEEVNWITEWMNQPDVKRALGVDHSPVDKFVSCNMTTNMGFYTQGQAMHNSAALLPELVKADIRLLAFAGDTDGVCNHIGIENWMARLEHKHHEDFVDAPLLPFITEITGEVGGKVRTAGGPGAGNVSFVQIFDGGHMAPHDQPEATLNTPNMRRAQSVRHYARTSQAHGADDLGVLREDESVEDVLRRQLLEKDRECDRLQIQIQSLQAQLAQRPPLEKVQALEKEYTNLEILLQGTQRENERCMAELERGKVREKMLERELEKLVGANWQSNLELGTPASASGFHARASGLANPGKSSGPAASGGAPSDKASVEATKAYVEQMRLMILGMEQRMQSREDKLAKHIERAEAEGARFEEVRRQALATTQ